MSETSPSQSLSHRSSDATLRYYGIVYADLLLANQPPAPRTATEFVAAKTAVADAAALSVLQPDIIMADWRPDIELAKNSERADAFEAHVKDALAIVKEPAAARIANPEVNVADRQMSPLQHDAQIVLASAATIRKVVKDAYENTSLSRFLSEKRIGMASTMLAGLMLMNFGMAHGDFESPRQANSLYECAFDAPDTVNFVDALSSCVITGGTNPRLSPQELYEELKLQANANARNMGGRTISGEDVPNYQGR